METRLRRLEQTAGELERAIGGKADGKLGRRPDAHNWSAKEIVCHLRDVEELFQIRFHTVLALDEPRVLVLGAGPDDLAAWRIPGRSRRQPSRAAPPGARRPALTGANAPAKIPRHERVDRAVDVVVAVPLRAASSRQRTTERRT